MSLPVIGSLGAGRMGRGIAHAFAFAGHEVLLIDAKERPAADAAALREQAFGEIRGSLAALAEAGAFDAALVESILSRVRFAPREEAPAALARADVLFEGVPEMLEAKRAAFAFAAPHLRAEAIVASTTSTMLSTELAAQVARPERFLNCHWLNPAYLIPLVELSPHAGTDPAVTARLGAILEAIGKKPVLCKAAPGFIVPRLQALVMNEAARMIEEGAATAEEIDKATRYGLGLRFAALGVVEFIDFGGVDILHHASREMSASIDAARYKAPANVDRLMAEGRLGLKTGSGFFDHRGRDVGAYRNDVLSRVLAMLRHQGMWREPSNETLD